MLMDHLLQFFGDELVCTVAITAGDFVADKLADWICRQTS